MTARNEDPTRDRILQAAGKVFAERGFEKATVRDICSAAEVNLGAVNYHFGDKQKLYVEVLLCAHQDFDKKVPLPQWSESDPPEQKLSDFVRTMMYRLLLAEGLPWQAQLLTREMVTPSEACRELSEKSIKPIHALLVGVLRELTPEETSETDLEKTAFSVIGQCVFYKMHAPVVETIVTEEQRADHFQPDQLAEHITRFTLSALGRGSLFELTSTVSETEANS